MKLGEYLAKKKWHILFLTQGLTLSSIYAHRFGFLDGLISSLDAVLTGEPAPLQPAKPMPVPIWKQLATKAQETKSDK
ncbi:hypothetical protein SDRG_03178 [Saprolegnia diclina VS20]|uniref:Uncharacterized protein n=1 Tax=Saprolegnia diclina (strain VS20) TaxID=1156394 RepID=T0SAC2_SAPDV|nr:hypothetical protein SDRG_03178 [Saprolegnia diclina VS20]EQC39752.1 hypothetical protein SDRG_03178 [Saprolegnia diclina VS20]|eukprot:XP_008607024.1 hypothetical protein SDRG_03178 [Saprolegnia diclina VS20]